MNPCIEFPFDTIVVIEAQFVFDDKGEFIALIPFCADPSFN